MSLIGIGGSLAPPPLPHHRTYGSVYGGSRSYADALRSSVSAGRSGSFTAESDSMSSRPACRASPVGADEKSSLNWSFSRLSPSRFMSYWPLLSFGPSATVPARPIRCLRLSALECLPRLADDMTCRVGGGGARALPPPARSNGSCSFPASRFPVRTPLRRRRRIEVLQCQSTPPGYPRCRRRVFRKANLSALPSCTCPFLVIRLCHTVRGLPPPHGLLGPSGVVIPR